MPNPIKHHSNIAINPRYALLQSTPPVDVWIAGKPLGGVRTTLLLPHPSGITVGLMGLVEGDWVETLSTIEPEDVK